MPSERRLNFFDILFRYSLILKLVKWKQIPSNLHTVLHNDKVRMWKWEKQKYLIYIRIQTFCSETRNWALVHPVPIDHDWSPPVVNSIDWTWFGKAHTCLYKFPQLTVHVRAKTKPWGRRNCSRAPKQDCVKGKIWERFPKNVCSIEGPQEHSGLHHS